MIIICANAPIAYTTQNGVHVVPSAALKTDIMSLSLISGQPRQNNTDSVIIMEICLFRMI